MIFSMNTAWSTQDPFAMASSVCSLDTPLIQWYCPRWMCHRCWSRWCVCTAGSLYNPASSASPEDFVLDIIDLMITMAYSDFMSLHDSTQSCLIMKTHIPWPVCALVLVVIAIFVALLALCVLHYVNDQCCSCSVWSILEISEISKRISKHEAKGI
jgi:hypothetical protein